METFFHEAELETLCFDLRYDYEQLPGKGKGEKVVELIKAFSRMGRIGELIDYCSQLRPNVPWEELRAEATLHPFALEPPPEHVSPPPPPPPWPGSASGLATARTRPDDDAPAGSAQHAGAAQPPDNRVRNILIGVGVAAMVVGGAAVGANRMGLFDEAAPTPTSSAATTASTAPTTPPASSTTAPPAPVEVAIEPRLTVHYPSVPSVAWELTLEQLGLDGEAASFGDPVSLTVISEGWVPAASALDAGDVWVTAVRDSWDGPWRLLGLSPENGEVRWSYAPDAEYGYLVNCSDTLIEGQLVCLAHNFGDMEEPIAEVVVIDMVDGREASRFTLPSDSRTISSAGPDIVVLMSTSVAGTSEDPTLSYEVARYTRDGELIWLTAIVTEGEGAWATDVMLESLEVGGFLVVADVMGAVRVLNLSDGGLIVDRGTAQGYCSGTEGDFRFRRDGSLVLTRVNNYGIVSVKILDTAGRETASLENHQLTTPLTADEANEILLRNPSAELVRLARNGLVTPTGVTAGEPSQTACEGFVKASLIDYGLVLADPTGLRVHSVGESEQLLWENDYLFSDVMADREGFLYGTRFVEEDGTQELMAIGLWDGSVQWTIPTPPFAAIQNVQGQLLVNSSSRLTVLAP